MEKPNEGRNRVVIENVQPQVNCGLFPIKRIVDDLVSVQADVFAMATTTYAPGCCGSRRARAPGRRPRCYPWETTAGGANFPWPRLADIATPSWVISTISKPGRV